MSKKVSLPVMSLTITGVLYIVGLLLVTLKAYAVPALITTPHATLVLVNEFLGFLSAFLILWALTSIVMHPDIDDSNLKWVFIFFGMLIAISVFTTLSAGFSFVMTLI